MEIRHQRIDRTELVGWTNEQIGFALPRFESFRPRSCLQHAHRSRSHSHDATTGSTSRIQLGNRRCIDASPLAVHLVLGKFPHGDRSECPDANVQCHLTFANRTLLDLVQDRFGKV